MKIPKIYFLNCSTDSWKNPRKCIWKFVNVAFCLNFQLFYWFHVVEMLILLVFLVFLRKSFVLALIWVGFSRIPKEMPGLGLHSGMLYSVS